MNTELFIATRIYKGDMKNEKRVSSPAIKIAVAGIALGLAAMMVSVCVIVGFKKEIRTKVAGFGSHIQITNFDSYSSYELYPISFSDTLAELIHRNPNVDHIQEFINKPGIIKTDNDFQGVVLKGVADDYEWEFFRKNLVDGEVINPNDTSGANQIIISKIIADKLRVKTGDSFIVYFVQEPIRMRRFVIKGIYNTYFENYDKMFAVADINVLRELNGWDADMVSGVEVLVKDYGALEQTVETMYFDLQPFRDRLSNAMHIRSIEDITPNIFNWLKLLDLNVWIIIILMLAVSGFTMISGLLIIILERTNMIGILKAMGARDFSIRKVFLYLSAFLIGKGMLWGNVIGLTFCIVQNQFKILKLDPASYYLSAVPIDLNPWYIVLLNVGTLLISLLMMIAPSFLVAKITPAKSIMFE